MSPKGMVKVNRWTKPKFKVGDVVMIGVDKYLPSSLAHYANRCAKVVDAGKICNTEDVVVKLSFDGLPGTDNWSQVWLMPAPLGKKIQSRLRFMYGNKK